MRRGEGVVDEAEEGRAVRELGQGVVVGEVMELLLQLGDVGERLLEAAVLEQHARMAGERPHERLLVPREGGDVARAVAGSTTPSDTASTSSVHFPAPSGPAVMPLTDPP